MPESVTKHSFGYTLTVLAAIVIILAGLKIAAVIVVPFLLALFIAVILSPAFLRLCDLHIPKAIALLIVILFLIGTAALLLMLIGSSIHEFTQNVPMYKTKLHQDFAAMTEMLKSYGISLPKEEVMAFFATDSIVEYIAKTLRSLGGLMTNSMMIVLTVAFMLLEVSQFSKKIASIDSPRLNAFVEVSDTVKHFILLKSITSLATGAIIAFGLHMLHIDYAVLWGVLAFLLNFIPNIGSVIAAVPAVLMALIQYDINVAMLSATLYLFVNITIGSILEPRIMGRGLGISPLVVFLSLIFWGWLLGPVGMLLSVPLTIMVKILLDATKETRWIAILLGNG